jgi:uncharacterized membrane protein (DUF2068 family)
MGTDEWLDLAFIKLIARHTSGVLSFLASVMLVSWAVKRAVEPEWLRAYVELSEQLLVVGTFVYLPLRVGYDLFREFKSDGDKH